MSQGEVKVVRVTSESGVLTGEIKMKKKKKSDINCPSSVKMSIVGVKNQVSPKQNKRKTGSSGKKNGFPSVAGLQLKYDSHSSSASSIEGNKPKRKLGRFDYSSSDCMSTEGCGISTSSSAVTSSSAFMDTGTNTDVIFPESTLTLSHSSMSSSFENRNENLKNVSCSTQKVMSADSESNTKQDDIHCISSTSTCTRPSKVSQDSTTELGLENLRWEEELSDEEEEKERIEKYKENRRKRYEKALLERKTKLVLGHTKGRILYSSAAT